MENELWSLSTFNRLAGFEGDRLPPRWQDQISTDNQAVLLYIPRWGLWSSCGLSDITLFTHMLQKMKRAIAADTLQMSVTWDNWACLWPQRNVGKVLICCFDLWTIIWRKRVKICSKSIKELLLLSGWSWKHDWWLRFWTKVSNKHIWTYSCYIMVCLVLVTEY